MERDFLGLNSKDSAIVMKEEEVEEGCKDSGCARSSGVSWLLSNKVSALSHFTSVKSEQDEVPSKMKSELGPPPGLFVKSGSDVLEASHKRQVDIQNGHSAHPTHDVEMHPFSMTNPFLKTHFTGACQNFGIGTMKQQFLGGNPLAACHPMLSSTASVAGTTEQWINSKASGVSAQLTIFYAGSVNVFDDISPEKAQAIMLLAGNGCILANMVQSKLHVQAPASKHPGANQALANQSMNMPPCSGLPSPISVCSHPIDQSGGAAAKSDDDKVAITIGMPTTLVNKAVPQRMLSSIGSVAATAMISSAVPQSRKASLARFLEKRKERAMSAAPYNVSKKEADCASTPESNGFGVSATSGVGSSSALTTKEAIGDFSVL